MRLLNLPAEIQRGVIEGKIMEGHARAILGLLDPGENAVAVQNGAGAEFKRPPGGSQG